MWHCNEQLCLCDWKIVSVQCHFCKNIKLLKWNSQWVVLKVCLVSSKDECESGKIILFWLLYLLQQFRNEISSEWCWKVNVLCLKITHPPLNLTDSVNKRNSFTNLWALLSWFGFQGTRTHVLCITNQMLHLCNATEHIYYIKNTYILTWLCDANVIIQ